MKRGVGLSEREVDELIERGRIVQPLSDVVRARALARARAQIAGEAAARAAPPAPALTAPARGHGLRSALAASIALVLGAAGAVAAIGVRIHDRTDPAAPSSAVAPPATRLEAPALALPSPGPEPKALPKLRRSTRPATSPESYAAELRLLQGAQVAYAERDFSGALVLVAEHARRFPNGRLAEEREALRVRSLDRSGRTEEARHAAGTFANRFPGSVLLPRLRQTAGTPD